MSEDKAEQLHLFDATKYKRGTEHNTGNANNGHKNNKGKSTHLRAIGGNPQAPRRVPTPEILEQLAIADYALEDALEQKKQGAMTQEIWERAAVKLRRMLDKIDKLAENQ